MANRTTRTPKKDEAFLAELAQTGNVGAAARQAGYGRTQLYQWRQAEAAFAEAWDDAVTEYTESLEAEADRRAVQGVVKPVFYLGETCGQIRQYSDTLLIFRLKALRPDVYRERVKLPAPATGPGQTSQADGEGLSPEEALRRIKRDVYGIQDEG